MSWIFYMGCTRASLETSVKTLWELSARAGDLLRTPFTFVSSHSLSEVSLPGSLSSWVSLFGMTQANAHMPWPMGNIMHLRPATPSRPPAVLGGPKQPSQWGARHTHTPLPWCFQSHEWFFFFNLPLLTRRLEEEKKPPLQSGPVRETSG